MKYLAVGFLIGITMLTLALSAFGLLRMFDARLH